MYEINPVACAVAPATGINSMEELIAKVNEGGVSNCSSEVGSLLHLAGVTVLKEFGIEDPLEQAAHVRKKVAVPLERLC